MSRYRDSFGRSSRNMRLRKRKIWKAGRADRAAQAFGRWVIMQIGSEEAKQALIRKYGPQQYDLPRM